MKYNTRFSWIFNCPADAAHAVGIFANHQEAHRVASLHVADEQVEPITTRDVTLVSVERVSGEYGTCLWRVNVDTEFSPYDSLDDYDGETPSVGYSPALFDGIDLPELPTYVERFAYLKGSFRATSNGSADDLGSRSPVFVNREPLWAKED